MMNRNEYLRNWSLVHGFEEGSEVAGIARIYLSLNFYLVQPLVVLRLPPNLVTLLAPLFAGFALLVDSHLAIATLLLASLMVDGFDGAVAIISERMSRIGGVWDGIIDRVTEFIWIIALYLGGISPAVLSFIWVLTATQEYGRAKLAHIAGPGLAVLTVCERPVRGLLVAFGFLGEIFFAQSLEIVVIIWLILQLVAFVQFSATAWRQLR